MSELTFWSFWCCYCLGDPELGLVGEYEVRAAGRDGKRTLMLHTNTAQYKGTSQRILSRKLKSRPSVHCPFWPTSPLSIHIIGYKDYTAGSWQCSYCCRAVLHFDSRLLAFNGLGIASWRCIACDPVIS